MEQNSDHSVIRPTPPLAKNKMKYKRNVVKEARVKGLPYVNYKGTHVTERKPGEDCR